MTQKKLISFFVHHKFVIFNFYIAHWQHVDLLRSDPRNKETFIPSFAHQPDEHKEVIKSCSGKKVFLLSRFYVCKTSVKGSYFSKNTSFFPATFAKINTVTGIFPGFYLDFKQFPIECNISRRLSKADQIALILR